MLTKKFIKLIEQATDGVLDLNHAADVLQVGGPGGRGEDVAVGGWVVCSMPG
jgi:hypothetical protein